MPRDVGIRISANTTEAQRSIRDLEDTIQGLTDLRGREHQQGFLSDDDIRHFHSLSEQATQVYRQFYQNYQSIVSNMEAKRRQLEQQIRVSTDNTKINDLRRQIADIDLQRVRMSSQRTIAENLQTRGTVYSQNPPTNQSGSNGNNGGSGGLFRRIMGMAGAISVGSAIHSGMQQISDQEASMAQLGTRIGGYGSNFARGRREAGNIGDQLGYTSGQSISLASQYTSRAGASSPRNMWNSVQNIERSSRQLGVNPDLLARSEGSMARVGAINNSHQQRNFANLIAGAVHQDHMEGRQGELINSINSLVQSTAQGQPDYNNRQANTVAGLEALIGRYDKGFKGQLGAQMLGGIDQSIRNGGNNIDLLMGWGTRYQGIGGRYRLQMRQAQGISNPDNLRDIFKNLEGVGGKGKQAEQLREMLLSETLGISLPQAHALYGNRRLRDEIMSGDYSSKDVKKLIKRGRQINERNGENYDRSNAGQRARNNAERSQTEQAAGSPFDFLSRGIQSLFNMQPAWLRGSELIGAGFGLKGMFNRFMKNGKNGDINTFRGSFKDFMKNRRTYLNPRNLQRQAERVWKGTSDSFKDFRKNRRTYLNPRNLQRQAGRTWERAKESFRDFGKNRGINLNPRNIQRQTGRVMERARDSFKDFSRNRGTYLNPRNLQREAGRAMERTRESFKNFMKNRGSHLRNVPHTSGGIWEGGKLREFWDKNGPRLKSNVQNTAGDIWRGTKNSFRDFRKNRGTYLNPRNIQREAGGLWNKVGGPVGRLAKGAGRILGPVGDFSMAKWAANSADSVGDWLFGHKKGDIKSPGILSNPFSNKHTRYRDNRKGALSNFWDTITGRRRSHSRDNDRRDFQIRRERNLENIKKINLDHRDRLINKDEKNVRHGSGSGIDKKDNRSVRDKEDEDKGNWFTDMISKIGDFFGGLFGGGSSGSLGGGVSDYIKKALQITGTSGSWAGPLTRLIQHESGGDPKAVNKWDSNAKAGHPSKGIMQMIDSTFNANAVKGHNDIFNPVDNIASGINYIKKRYGSVFKVPGIMALNNGKKYVGYANGTDSSSSGSVVIGENGPELVSTYDGRMALANKATSFDDFMSGSSVQPVNRVSNVHGANWNQNVSGANGSSGSSGSGSGSRSVVVNVRVSGSIDGLNKENNAKVADSIAGYFNNSTPFSYDFSRS